MNAVPSCSVAKGRWQKISKHFHSFGALLGYLATVIGVLALKPRISPTDFLTETKDPTQTHYFVTIENKGSWFNANLTSMLKLHEHTPGMNNSVLEEPLVVTLEPTDSRTIEFSGPLSFGGGQGKPTEEGM